MVDKAPTFNPPRQVSGKAISKRQYDEETLSPLPSWVRCKICKKPPEGLNWLKPVSPDPACRVFVHLGCVRKD